MSDVYHTGADGELDGVYDDADCVDGSGAWWPEHHAAADEHECRRCGAEIE